MLGKSLIAIGRQLNYKVYNKALGFHIRKHTTWYANKADRASLDLRLGFRGYSSKILSVSKSGAR